MRLHRLLGILSILLSRETVLAKELSDTFEVSIRTIYRDVKAIEEAGIPLYATPGNGGGIGIVPQFKLNKTVLSGDEINYLMTGISGLKSITDTEKLQILLSKLCPSHSYLTVDSDILIDFSSWNKNTTEALKQKVNLIRLAILNKNYLQVEYISAKQKSSLIIAPAKIVFKNAAWYLFGKSTTQEEHRFYKLTRITSLAIRRDSFVSESVTIPADWSDDFNEDSGEKVTLVFDESLEYQVIDFFGKDGYEQKSDHSIVVTFPCSNREWLIHFVLGFGLKASIVSPPDLKEEYLDYLKKMVEKNHC